MLLWWDGRYHTGGYFVRECEPKVFSTLVEVVVFLQHFRDGGGENDRGHSFVSIEIRFGMKSFMEPIFLMVKIQDMV